jgi:hypothetical protein
MRVTRLMCNLLVITLLQCGPSNRTKAATEEQESRLADGSHTCSAQNESTGNGPYELDCETVGNSVTVHFTNGGYLEGSGTVEEGPPWEFEAYDSRGNSWSITIND